jgi:hypothetical protein
VFAPEWDFVRLTNVCVSTTSAKPDQRTPSNPRPVDRSALANRAVRHALSLVAGHAGPEIVLFNVQHPQTLDISDISAMMTIDVDQRVDARSGEDRRQDGDPFLGALTTQAVGLAMFR